MVKTISSLCSFTYKPAEFFPNNVDPNLCTHLTYFTIGHRKITISTDLPFLFLLLYHSNDKLGALLAIGGPLLLRFTQMVASRGTQQTFIDSVIVHLRKVAFDGIYLDFEYLGSRGRPAEDKHHFTVLVQEILEAFTAEAASSGKLRLLITAPVFAGKATIDAGYEIAEIGKLLDFISVMTYDFHGGWDTFTGHNSPLHQGSETGSKFPLKYAMEYWRDNGVPAEKLLMGFPTYGHTFRLTSSDASVGAPASGAGSSGPYTREAGFWAFYGVRCFYKLGFSAEVNWIDDQKVPYAYRGNKWVGFDNICNYKHRVKYLKDNNFGGSIVWAIDLDDFLGTFCNEGKYPLINQSCIPHETTTEASVATTPSTDGRSTTPAPSSNRVLFWKPDGTYVHPDSHTQFHMCSHGRRFTFTCSAGLVFDESCMCCNCPKC
uniref:chitinase n=1 Tax=Crocodylus porosus TaxID=8502 RepID=A0A7M4EWS2_CROPO